MAGGVGLVAGPVLSPERSDSSRGELVHRRALYRVGRTCPGTSYFAGREVVLGPEGLLLHPRRVRVLEPRAYCLTMRGRTGPGTSSSAGPGRTRPGTSRFTARGCTGSCCFTGGGSLSREPGASPGGVELVPGQFFRWSGRTRPGTSRFTAGGCTGSCCFTGRVAVPEPCCFAWRSRTGPGTSPAAGLDRTRPGASCFVGGTANRSAAPLQHCAAATERPNREPGGPASNLIVHPHLGQEIATPIVSGRSC